MVGRIFTPGNEPGSIATGFVDNAGIMERAARNLRLRGIPVGDSVAKLFPWLRYVRQPVYAGQQAVVKRRQWEATFTNQTPRPIKITELRFAIAGAYGGEIDPDQEGDADVHPTGFFPTFPGVDPGNAFQKYLWVKLSIPPRRDLIQKWMPLHNLNTEIDHCYPGELDRFAIELPAPYFLNHSHPFVIDVGRNIALRIVDPRAGGEDLSPFWLSLHGFGLLDGEPLDLIKGVPAEPLPEDPGDPGGTSYHSVTFNDDRDLPMRDAVITHIGVGAGSQNNTELRLHNIQIRPQAPEGPTWHSGEFFPITVLAKHVAGLLQALPEDLAPLAVRHVPIAPYTILPGERFLIELWNRTDTAARAFSNVQLKQDLYVHVGLIGTQEGSA